MSVAWTEDSDYAKEARKWESQHSKLGPPGRPYRFEEFPQAMYRASRPVGGGQPTFERLDAHDEAERDNLASRGYRVGQDVALQALEASDQAVALAAAERAFSDRRMSDKAIREADAADAATASHVPSIPEQPKRGRPRKSEVSHGV